MKVGERLGNGGIVQTPRTIEKINETFKLVMSHADNPTDSLRDAVFSALVWTADDVLEQAVEDGYKSTVEGIL